MCTSKVCEGAYLTARADVDVAGKECEGAYLTARAGADVVIWYVVGRFIVLYTFMFIHLSYVV